MSSFKLTLVMLQLLFPHGKSRQFRFGLCILCTILRLHHVVFYALALHLSKAVCSQDLQTDFWVYQIPIIRKLWRETYIWVVGFSTKLDNQIRKLGDPITMICSQVGLNHNCWDKLLLTQMGCGPIQKPGQHASHCQGLGPRSLGTGRALVSSVSPELHSVDVWEVIHKRLPAL